MVSSSLEAYTNKKIKSNCDCYSFGCIAYEIIFGRPIIDEKKDKITNEKALEKKIKYFEKHGPDMPYIIGRGRTCYDNSVMYRNEFPFERLL